MGYTHYWYRPEQMNAEKFAEFAGDCKQIAHYCQHRLGIDLDIIQINFDFIGFNGSDSQRLGVWTTTEDVTIPWPSSTASLNGENPDPSADKTAGRWFAGTLASQRVAPIGGNGLGDGSYETFVIEQEIPQGDGRHQAEDGTRLRFECCKTAYRPYDLAVTACLIALKHHFPVVVIRTDGQEKDWLDGKILCNNLLGYGMDFQISEESPKEYEEPAPVNVARNIAPKSTKKITLATVKSFVKKNRNGLYIRVGSRFDGMNDCVMPVNGGFSPAKESGNTENTLGIAGAWFVRDSRDWFTPYDDGTFTGYEVSNCCGNFILAIKKGV